MLRSERGHSLVLPPARPGRSCSRAGLAGQWGESREEKLHAARGPSSVAMRVMEKINQGTV